MTEKDTLGIIVNSNRHFDFVTKLAEAATGNAKQVCIHLLGAGCEFVKTEACARLSQRARITLCADSARRVAPQAVDKVPGSVSLVPTQELTRILERCQRYVVF